MPRNRFEDDEEEFEPKFGTECAGCKHINRPRVCAGCHAGEEYEEEEPEGLDSIFKRSAW